MCEPLSTGAALASLPSRRTKRLPMASVNTPKQRALAHEASSVRAAASSGDSAWRLTPPLGVPPSFAMSACLCQRRSSLTALAPLMHPPFSARAIARVLIKWNHRRFLLIENAMLEALRRAQFGRPAMHNHLERNLIGYGPNPP